LTKEFSSQLFQEFEKNIGNTAKDFFHFVSGQAFLHQLAGGVGNL